MKDSLGNRETYQTPGMQWISVGSGIEHAEGGGTPLGGVNEGFQIWVNVPGEHKMDDPRYGTVPPENLPLFDKGGIKARVMAGNLDGLIGPFKTVQDVQMIDFMIPKKLKHEHALPAHYNNCLVYVYKGSMKINGESVKQGRIVRLNAESGKKEERLAVFEAVEDAACLLFSGVRLNEPIAWHGPFVMNTDQEISKWITSPSGLTVPRRDTSRVSGRDLFKKTSQVELQTSSRMPSRERGN